MSCHLRTRKSTIARIYGFPERSRKVMPSAPPGLLYPGDPGVPAGLIPTDKKAFAPRLGLAWDPTGSGKWLVSAAYGIFYEPYYTGQGGPLQSPISAPPYLQTPQVKFSRQLICQSLLYAGPFHRPAFAEPMTILTLSPNLSLPYAQDWDLNIQRSLGNDWLAQVGYVGTTGVKLPRFIEGNPTVFMPGRRSRAAIRYRTKTT